MDAFDLSLRQELNSGVKVLLARSFQKKYWRMLSWSAAPEPVNFNSALTLCKQEMGNSMFSSSKSDILKTRRWEPAQCSHHGICIHTVFSLWNQPTNFLLCLLFSYLNQKFSLFEYGPISAVSAQLLLHLFALDHRALSNYWNYYPHNIPCN